MFTVLRTRPRLYSLLSLESSPPHCPHLLTDLLNPPLRFGYHPASLKRANGVVLDKPGKPSYDSPASFRIIVLLQTISKILEPIVAYRLAEEARALGLIHRNQCGSLPALFSFDACLSLVDTVRISGSVDFVNRSGTGSVTFQVYFDTVKTAVYTSTPAFSVSGPVTPGVTTSSPFVIPDLSTALKPMFLASTVYVGIRASATGTIAGTAKLTALRARIVIQDKLF